MAGSFGDTVENYALNHIFRRVTWTIATPMYVALSVAAPGESGSTASEPTTPGSGKNYARVAIYSGTWNAAVGGSLDNALAITFNEASADWGTISHFMVYTQSTAGTMICWGSLDTAKTISSNDTPRFAAGDLKISLD